MGVLTMRSVSRSHAYHLFMLAVCLYALGALAAHTFLTLTTSVSQILDYADTGVCFLFFIDFIHSFIRSHNKWEYLYTWGWIDLASSIPLVPALRIGRAARVMRIFRVLRGIRATKLLAGLVLDRRAEGAFLAAVLVSFLLIVFSSIAVLQFETIPESNIKTAGDALWWAIVTVTTVGYGDRFPVTPEGRAVGGILMIAGVGLFGVVSGFVAAWFLAPKQTKTTNDMANLRDEVRSLKVLIEERLSPNKA